MAKVHVNEKDNEVSINIEKANFMWFVHYMDGYYRSTIELVDKLSIKDNDTLIYPVLFSFSHYFELWLKLLVLTANDSSNVKELKLDVHTIKHIIKNMVEKNCELLKSYDVDIDSLLQIESKYQYFNDFVINGNNLSMSSRFPLDNKTDNIIINFDKIDEIEKDNYVTFKNNVFDILSIANEITKKFFRKWFSNCFNNIDLNSLIQSDNK
jgi:hypothetical protein